MSRRDLGARRSRTIAPRRSKSGRERVARMGLASRAGSDEIDDGVRRGELARCDDRARFWVVGLDAKGDGQTSGTERDVITGACALWCDSGRTEDTDLRLARTVSGVGRARVEVYGPVEAPAMRRGERRDHTHLAAHDLPVLVVSCAGRGRVAPRARGCGRVCSGRRHRRDGGRCRHRRCGHQAGVAPLSCKSLPSSPRLSAGLVSSARTGMTHPVGVSLS